VVPECRALDAEAAFVIIININQPLASFEQIGINIALLTPRKSKLKE
jgi:hypothetical protein